MTILTMCGPCGGMTQQILEAEEGRLNLVQRTTNLLNKFDMYSASHEGVI